MSLSAEITRCDGGNRPSKTECRRYIERNPALDSWSRAALWLRREAGADACDLIMPTAERLSTFEGNRMEAS